MSEVWSTASIHVQNKKDYDVIVFLCQELIASSIETYDAQNYCIELTEGSSGKDTFAKLAKIFDKSLRKMAEQYKDAESREWLETLCFKITATSEYIDDGEQCDYIIERGNRQLTMRETDNYVYCQQDDDSATYEDFCAMFSDYFDPETDEFVSEEDFDPTSEFYITNGKVYVNEKPAFYYVHSLYED